MSATPPEPPAVAGYLHKSGCPALKIRVWGVSETLAQEFEAIVDTGFSGFLSMPMVQAFPLGLVLFGTTKVVLADGSTDTKLTALGNIGLEGGLNKAGVIILETNISEILVGVDFLNQFERSLVLFGERAIPQALRSSTKPLILIDNKLIHAVLDAIREAAEKAAQDKARAQTDAAQLQIQSAPETNASPEADPTSQSN